MTLHPTTPQAAAAELARMYIEFCIARGYITEAAAQPVAVEVAVEVEVC